MIKRRFYKLEHGDKDVGSDSSGFSSDSEVEEEVSAESGEESEDDSIAEVSEDESTGELKEEDGSSPTSSAGLENEDNNSNADDSDAADADAENDDDADNDDDDEEDMGSPLDTKLPKKEADTKPQATDAEEMAEEIPDCMIKCKKVYKCRFCPTVICLNEKTIEAHISSKKHARSEKQAEEGKLKAFLNSDGELEEQDIVEDDPVSDSTHSQKKKGKKGRRQRQSERAKEKKSGKRGEKEAVEQRPKKKSRKTKDE